MFTDFLPCNSTTTPFTSHYESHVINMQFERDMTGFKGKPICWLAETLTANIITWQLGCYYRHVFM